jgi:hypothetical protein
MAKKEKKGRRAHLDHFRMNDEGQFVYKGDLYTFSGDRSHYMKKLWICCVLIMIAVVLEGCIQIPGMDDCFYVLIPYVITLMSAVSVCWAMGRLTAGGYPLKEYVYEATVPKLPERTVWVILFAGLGTVCGIIYVLTSGTDGKTAGFIIFLILNLIVIFLAYRMRQTVLSMQWHK